MLSPAPRSGQRLGEQMQAPRRPQIPEKNVATQVAHRRPFILANAADRLRRCHHTGAGPADSLKCYPIQNPGAYHLYFKAIIL